MKRRTRTFEDSSMADIARAIAGDLGLTPRITGFSDPIGTQVQMNESDLAFLRRLLARYDGDVQVVGSELHVSPRGEVRRSAVELALRSQLRRATVLADLAHQVSEVTVTGWDPARGASASPGAAAVRSRDRAAGGEAAICCERARPPFAPDRAPGGEHERRSHRARQRGLRRAAAPFRDVDGTAEGNPAVRAGTHLDSPVSARASTTPITSHAAVTASIWSAATKRTSPPRARFSATLMTRPRPVRNSAGLCTAATSPKWSTSTIPNSSRA